MENSSPSQNSHDSPIVFPPDAFGWGGTISFIVGAVLFFFAAVILLGVGYGLWAHLGPYAAARALSGMPGVTIQSAAEILVIVYILTIFPSIAKTTLAGIGFRRISQSAAGTIVLGTILMFVIIVPLASALQNMLHFRTPEEAIAVFTRAAGWQKAAFAFFGVVVAPFFEELVFRIVLFNVMRYWWGFWPGAIVSSLLFGLAHSQPPFTPAMYASITLPLAAGGLVLCFVYARTSNAWSNIITHGAFNGLQFILLVLFPQLAK